jgi:hypothetical protein
MTVIDDTRLRYPELAKQGWCFCFNKSKEDIPHFDGLRALSFMSHMKPTLVMVGVDHPAYCSNGSVYPNGVPIFVRVTDTDCLMRLGFEGQLCRDKETGRIHHMGQPVKNRFDILDI